MAIVDITEYEKLASDMTGKTVAGGQEPSITNQQVAITASSTQSNAFDAKTNFVRVHADAPARISVGANPTASATTQRMAAGQTEYFGVKPGHKIAVITTT